MTRMARRVAQLSDIRDLRALGERVAEARAAQSARASHEQEERCRADERRLEAALDEWRAALAEPRFDPARASLYSQAVDRLNRTRAQSFADLAALAAQLDRARRECSEAQAGHRCAAELLKDAERRHLGLLEEKAMAARDDASAWRAAAS